MKIFICQSDVLPCVLSSLFGKGAMFLLHTQYSGRYKEYYTQHISTISRHVRLVSVSTSPELLRKPFQIFCGHNSTTFLFFLFSFVYLLRFLFDKSSHGFSGYPFATNMSSMFCSSSTRCLSSYKALALAAKSYLL